MPFDRSNPEQSEWTAYNQNSGILYESKENKIRQSMSVFTTPYCCIQRLIILKSIDMARAERTPASPVGRTEQLRKKFNGKYGWLVPHFRRILQPEPDYSVDPNGHREYRKSRKIKEWLEDNGRYRVIAICERLAEPVNDRISRIVEETERTHWVESPTNAKQTRRAIDQIDQRLDAIITEAMADPYGTLSNLRAVREKGGFDARGVFHQPDEASQAAIDAQIQELTTPSEFDLKHARALELERERYRRLLPENRAK